MQIPSNAPPAYGSGTANVNLPKQATSTPEPKADTIQLSSQAKAKLLKQQGASNSSIANQLGLDIKTVTGYFSTPTATAATTSKSENPAPEAVKNTIVQAQGATQAKK